MRPIAKRSAPAAEIPHGLRKLRRWSLVILVAALVPPMAVWLSPRSDPGALPLRSRTLGPGSVGAAEVPLTLRGDVSLAGYGPFRGRSRDRGAPLMARALVIGDLAIVSLDLLEIPFALRREVERRADTPLLFLCATHTHTGPGGYDPEPLPELVGAREFSRQRFEAIAQAAAEAIRQARAKAQPASLRVAVGEEPQLKVGRSRGATPDPKLWALRADAADGRPIATLVSFGAHPTLARRTTLSPDWPAAAATALERSGGLAIVVQGIGGDSSAVAPGALGDRVTQFGESVAAAAERLLASSTLVPQSSMSFAREPAPLEFDPLGPAHVPLQFGAPVHKAVAVASVGTLRLVCLPGEITGAAWHELATAVPALATSMPITLCDDELSYVEGKSLWSHGQGERWVLFPNAVAELGTALGAAMRE